jgi:hypothetical protein
LSSSSSSFLNERKRFRRRRIKALGGRDEGKGLMESLTP